MYPTDLTDDQWAQIEPIIPPARPGGNRRRIDVRSVVNGLLYRAEYGRAYLAPACYPPRTTLNEYQKRWRDGTFDRILTIVGGSQRLAA